MSDPELLRSRDFLRAQCVGEICLQAPLDLESFDCSKYVCHDTMELLELTKILTVHHPTNGARLLCCQKIVGGLCLRFQLMTARFRQGGESFKRMRTSKCSYSGPERRSWLTDNSIMVIPLEGKSAGLLVTGQWYQWLG